MRIKNRLPEAAVLFAVNLLCLVLSLPARSQYGHRSVLADKLVQPAMSLAFTPDCAAILYILGILSNRPCDDVKVVAKEPAISAPCTVPAAPPSDCISITWGAYSHRLVSPWLSQLSQLSQASDIGDDGVMG